MGCKPLPSPQTCGILIIAAGLQLPLFLLSLDLSDALLGSRQILRHGAAQFLDGLANLLTNLVMGIISCLLSLNVLAAQLLIGLGRTE